MKSGSQSNYRLNSELEAKRDLISLLDREDITSLLQDFDFDWDNGQCNTDSDIFKIFNSQGWIEDGNRTSRLGRLVFGRLALHFEHYDKPSNHEVNNYHIYSRVRSGKNSVIFSGEHRILGFKVILKFIRPGASDDIESSLKKVSNCDFGSTVVMPNDIFYTSVPDVCGRNVDVTCLVFPFIRGQSFNDFLNSSQNHYNPHITISYIKQIGEVLEKLENIGAYHGDLHPHNILVVKTPNGRLEFKLLDISFDMEGID